MEIPRIPDDSVIPPGTRPPVDHVDTFLAKYQIGSKNYLSRFDEALFDSFENAWRMRLDPVVMDPLRTRQRSLLSTSWHIEADDAEDDEQEKAAANIDLRVRRMPQLATFLLACKEDIWFGRAGAQVQYKWKKVDDVWGIQPVGSIPVSGDKLVYFYDSDDIGIRVNATFKGSTVVTDYGMVHKFTPAEREALVVGCFEPEDVDYRKPYFAGAIKGLGLRHRLYWWWSLKNQAAKYLADYLQWFAQGLTIYQFDAHNQNAEAELQKRLQQYQGLPFLLYPRFHDGGPGYDPVVRISADSQSATFLMDLMRYYDTQIRSMILGQTFMTTGGQTGLGDGVPTAAMQVAAEVLKYDCNTTADYLTSDLIRVMYEYTYPGMTPGRWVFEVDSTNVGQLQQSVQLFTELGGKVGEETLRKELGIPDTKPNENTLGKMDDLDPTALTGTPSDTPIVNPKGS